MRATSADCLSYIRVCLCHSFSQWQSVCPRRVWLCVAASDAARTPPGRPCVFLLLFVRPVRSLSSSLLSLGRKYYFSPFFHGLIKRLLKVHNYIILLPRTEGRPRLGLRSPPKGACNGILGRPPRYSPPYEE